MKEYYDAPLARGGNSDACDFSGCCINLPRCGTELCSLQFNAELSAQILQLISTDTWEPGYANH